jgi:hypothetical protein
VSKLTIDLAIQQLSSAIKESYDKETFAKITLAKPNGATPALKNVYIRQVVIKSNKMLSFCFRYQTRDETKNFDINEAISEIEKLFSTVFSNLDLFTAEKTTSYQRGKGETVNIILSKPIDVIPASTSHDKLKHRFIEPKGNIYLRELGVTNPQGQINVSMNDKFRQIDKYIEIIDSLVKEVEMPNPFYVSDMGAGKGYLTFALYDYLKNKLKVNAIVNGIEYQEKMVNTCNTIASRAGFDNLSFIKSTISEYSPATLDMLIALHACDTATDDALFLGIKAMAKIIVVAPCCHKQVRRDLVIPETLKQILKHGIFEERTTEMLTDSIRALLLELNGYRTKVFEFISNEHTGKNLMITAVKMNKEVDTEIIKEEIRNLKERFGVTKHYLEERLKA